jgi:hypothetical protein
MGKKCSYKKKTVVFNKTKKRMRGGLAYSTNNIVKPINSNLAYTNSNLNRAYPASGPVAAGFNWIVPQIGGGKSLKHRKKCKCSNCKCNMHKIKKKGGGSFAASNGGLPYPNGLLGEPWTPNVSTWPGVDGISMNRNYLPYNNLDTLDLKTNQLNIGAQPPFTYFGGKNKKTKNKRSKRRQKGGWGNIIGSDLINVGRQIPYNIGSIYNGITGYPAPVNPLPYKDQLTRDPVSYNLYT